MAFDVYVGTMTRFYRREWENVAQRMSREQGIRYSMIYAGGEPEPPPPANEIRQAISAWCEGISISLKEHGVGPITWDEGDEQPYFTDRPGWEGYRALLVWAAHAEHQDLPLPDIIPTSWVDDEAYEESVSRDFRSRYLSILRPEIWIPAEFPFVFDGPTLVADQGCIGSVLSLKRELDELHAETADKLRADKLRADKSRQKSQPATPAVAEKPGFFGRLFGTKTQPRPAPQPQPTLAEGAEFGLAVFRELAEKACENRLPMLLSY